MHPWLAARTTEFDSSGIRKMFDLASQMKDPINLSIGQPDFPVPDTIKQAAIKAIKEDKNGYSVTQGVAELQQTRLYPGSDRTEIAGAAMLFPSCPVERTSAMSIPHSVCPGSSLRCLRV